MNSEQLQEEVNEYVADLKEKLIPMTKVQVALAEDGEFIEAMQAGLRQSARYCKLAFDALIAEGFTEDQAVRIVAANDPTPKLSF